MPQQDFDLILKVQADLKEATKQLRSLNDGMRVTSSSAKQASGSLDRMERSADSGAKGVGKITQQLDGMGSSVKSAAGHLKTLAAVIGVAFVVHKVADWTRSLIDANEQLFQLAKQAEGLNVSVKFFSGLTQQADDLGIGVQQVSVVMGTLNRQLATAQRGSATAKGLFASFGIDPNKVKSTEQAFLGIADSVAKYGVNAKRAGELTQIFGASGKDIVPILKQGAAAIRAQNDAMEKTGQIITEKDVPAIVQLHNATDQIGDSFTALKNKLIIQLAPSISKIADQFNEFVTTHGPAFSKEISDIAAKLPELAQRFFDIASAAIKAGSKVATFFDQMGQGLGIVLAQLVTGTDNPDDVLQTARAEIGHINSELKTLATYGKQSYGVNVGAPDEVIRRLLGLDFSAPVTKKVVDDAIAHLTRVRQNVLHGIASIKSGKGGPTVPGRKNTIETPTVPTQSDPSGGATPDPAAAKAAAARALAIAQQAAAAQDALTQSLIRMQGALDPSAAAWAKYNATVKAAQEQAAAVAAAHPEQAAALKSQVQAVTDLAARQRDATLAELQHADAAKQLAAAMAQAQTILSNQGRQEQQIQAEQQAGLISEYTARQRILALHQQTATALDALLPKLRELVAATDDPRAIENLKNLEGQIAQLKLQANDFQQAFESGFTGGVEQAFSGLVAGTSNVRQAFQQLAQSVAQSMAQIAARILASKALDALGGLFGGGGKDSSAGMVAGAAAVAGASGVLTGASVALGVSATQLQAAATTLMIANSTGMGLGFASGGYTGAGPRNTPAGIVHKGEGVLSQPEIAALGGPAGFYALRRGLRGYADGGLVTGPSLDSLAPRIPAPRRPAFRLPAANDGGNRGAAPQVGVRIINSIDPQFVTDHMASSAGEKVILNVIARNRARVKQTIG